MTLTKRPDGWWITNTPPGIEEMGPYRRRADAAVDRRGVVVFLANIDRRSFFTTERKEARRKQSST